MIAKRAVDQALAALVAFLYLATPGIPDPAKGRPTACDSSERCYRSAWSGRSGSSLYAEAFTPRRPDAPATEAQPTADDAPPEKARTGNGREARGYYEIVYADANIGASSGGHSALKFGNTIYHYQMYADGIFRLVREDWSEFRSLYNERENRTLGLRTVHLPAAQLRRLEDFFALRFLVQLRHLDFYSELNHELELWRALSASPQSPRVPIPGYGLFASDRKRAEQIASASPALDADGGQQLNAYLAANAGGGALAEVLAARRAAIQLRLRADLGEALSTAPLVGPAYPEAGEIFQPDRVPLRPELFSRSVRADLAELAALDVLERSLPLRDEALMDAFDGFASEAPTGLRDSERAALLAFRAQLGDEILDLLRSPAERRGIDRGATLLLNIARHRALSLSLSRDRLLTLDPFPARRVRVTAAAIQRERGLAHRLAARARREAEHTRSYVFTARGGLNERRYNRLEADAGRAFEIQRGARERGYSIRVARSPMIPGEAYAAEFPLPAAALPASWVDFVKSGDGLATREAQARKRRDAYLETLRRGYDYHLIRKNCVTELLLSIEAGGGVPADMNLKHRLRFIPFVAFDLFAPVKRANANANANARSDADAGLNSSSNLRWLPSHRKRRLARLLEREGPLAAPRESFATNSTIYTPRAKDTAFLLFTDDVFWPRPLYGAANLSYGVATAGAGVFSAPFDRGARLRSGLRGALFSLPELVWFNIRKGSYDFPEEPPAAP